VRRDLDDDVDLIGDIVAGGDLVEVHKGVSVGIGSRDGTAFRAAGKKVKQGTVDQLGLCLFPGTERVRNL
jgi:hypothetical protein